MPVVVLRRAAPAVVGLLLLAAALGASPAQAGVHRDEGSSPKAQGSGTVTFGIAPATATQPDTSRAGFSWSGSPGGTLFDHAALTNYGRRPITLQVYATDALNTSSGGFGLLAGNKRPTDAGAWITIPDAGKPIRVPPATKRGPGFVVVPMTVRIPANATPGDHTAGVLAVLTTTSRGTTSSPGVKLLQRVGSRVFVQVSGPLRPRLEVTDLSVRYQGDLNPFTAGSAVVSFTMTNTGNVNLGVNGTATVSGLLTSAKAALAPVPLLLPGGSATQQVTVSGVWPQVFMRAGLDLVPEAVTTTTPVDAPAASASTRFVAIPWALLIALVLLLAVGWWVVRRRRNPKQSKGRRAKPKGGSGKGRRRAGKRDADASPLQGVGAP